jgi:soluble lytic murein transglycosylase
VVKNLTFDLDMARVVCVRALVAAVVVACSHPESAPAQIDAPTSPFSTSREPAVRQAASAVAAGRAWRAAEILDSAYHDPETRTPEVVLLMGTAAAKWGGWSRVERELAGVPWLDSLHDGAGWELLTRAALARGADSVAQAHAETALRLARTDYDRGVREVLLARALDRRALGDSAAAGYVRAAGHLPAIGDWLRLRAAGATADSTRRQRHYQGVSSAVARARIAPSEAQALERWRDFAGAARTYAELGERAHALRLRLLASPDSATRRTVRVEAFSLLTARHTTAEASTVIMMLDTSLGPLSASEEIVVARAAREAGLLARAATGFARAATLEPADRFAYATVLSRLGRDADAAAQFARVPAGSPVGAGAAYQRARSLLRAGRGSEARAALRRVVQSFRSDTNAASSALFVLADLATDDGRDADARASFLDVARGYPSSSLAPSALFRAAIIAFASANYAAAARDFDVLIERYPRAIDVTAARYWSGRAREAAGERPGATERWREVMTNDPMSYYAMRSASRLGTTWWRPAERGDSLRLAPTLQGAVSRAALLESLGMTTEESFEYDAIASTAGTAPESLLVAAEGLRMRGEVSRAMGLARRALAGSTVRDARAYRLAYPLAYGDVIRTEAASHGIDPALAAALIHQESSFTPHATSRAGALGLMQVLPSVGASIARARGMSSFERVLLYQPDVNVRLGMTHLDAMIEQYPHVEYALAAYNAGGSPVRRWRAKPGTDDPELFVERIPYDETRDYVRILLRNQATYKTLYAW